MSLVLHVFCSISRVPYEQKEVMVAHIACEMPKIRNRALRWFQSHEFHTCIPVSDVKGLLNATGFVGRLSESGLPRRLCRERSSLSLGVPSWGGEISCETRRYLTRRHISFISLIAKHHTKKVLINHEILLMDVCGRFFVCLCVCLSVCLSLCLCSCFGCISVSFGCVCCLHRL